MEPEKANATLMLKRQDSRSSSETDPSTVRLRARRARLVAAPRLTRTRDTLID